MIVYCINLRMVAICMTSKVKTSIPSILNMSDFILVGEVYEDNHIAGDIKGKYRLKTAVDDLGLSIDDPAYKEYLQSSSLEFYQIKQMGNNNLIADYVGSYFAHYLIDGRAPIVHLAKDEKGNVYTASKFIPNFYGVSDYEVRSNNCISEGCFIGEDGKIHPLSEKVEENNHTIKFQLASDKEEVYAAAEFVSYPDPNGSNNGIIISDNVINFAVIDFDLSMTELSKPLELVYFQNRDIQKLIAALKSVTNKISKEFIEESLDQLFENIATVIHIEADELNSKKTQMANDLINRLKIYKTDTILLEIQEIIQSNFANQQELLDLKCAELDSLVLPSSPSRVLLNTAGMVYGKHQATFDKLDSLIKEYKQDNFKTILYAANRFIGIHKEYEGEYSEILINTMPYIISKDGIATINKILVSLLNKLDILIDYNKTSLIKSCSVLTHKILAHLEKFPEVLYETIDDIFYKRGENDYAFNIAFPYIASNDEYRNKIIDKAIDRKQIFDSIIPYLSYKDKCSVLTLADPDQCFVNEDFYGKRKEHFLSDMLTHQQDQNLLIGEA